MIDVERRLPIRMKFEGLKELVDRLLRKLIFGWPRACTEKHNRLNSFLIGYNFLFYNRCRLTFLTASKRLQFYVTMATNLMKRGDMQVATERETCFYN